MPRKRERRRPERATRGAGFHLHGLIKTWLKIDFWAGCGCKELAKEMNRHPPEWSLEPKRFNRIVNKMRATARKAPKWRLRLMAYLPGVQYPIRAMVREAVKRAMDERDSKQSEKQK